MMNGLKILLRLRRNRIIGIVFGVLLIAGLLLPEELIIPVKGAAPRDWNSNSWWYEPWVSLVSIKG